MHRPANQLVSHHEFFFLSLVASDDLWHAPWLCNNNRNRDVRCPHCLAYIYRRHFACCGNCCSSARCCSCPSNARTARIPRGTISWLNERSSEHRRSRRGLPSDIYVDPSPPHGTAWIPIETKNNYYSTAVWTHPEKQIRFSSEDTIKTVTPMRLCQTNFFFSSVHCVSLTQKHYIIFESLSCYLQLRCQSMRLIPSIKARPILNGGPEKSIEVTYIELILAMFSQMKCSSPKCWLRQIHLGHRELLIARQYMVHCYNHFGWLYANGT